LKIILHRGTNSTNSYNVKRGDRIAQILIEKSYSFSWEEIQEDELKKTERGSGGFGSTGN